MSEVAVQASLHHPNIISLFGFHHSPDQELTLMMEYAAGGTLNKHLDMLSKRGWSVDADDAMLWLAQLASALKYMHSKTVLHRDVSAENVLMSFDGDVLLSDFGLSHKLADEHEQLKTNLCGTPPFISPELVAGKEYGAPNDVWALGVLVFQILTFQLPFNAWTLDDLKEKILQHRLEPAAAAAIAARSANAPEEDRECTEKLLWFTSSDAALHHDPQQRVSLDVVLREIKPLVMGEVEVPDVAPTSNSELSHDANTAMGTPHAVPSEPSKPSVSESTDHAAILSVHEADREAGRVAGAMKDTVLSTSRTDPMDDVGAAPSDAPTKSSRRVQWCSVNVLHQAPSGEHGGKMRDGEVQSAVQSAHSFHAASTSTKEPPQAKQWQTLPTEVMREIPRAVPSDVMETHTKVGNTIIATGTVRRSRKSVGSLRLPLE